MAGSQLRQASGIQSQRERESFQVGLQPTMIFSVIDWYWFYKFPLNVNFIDYSSKCYYQFKYSFLGLNFHVGLMLQGTYYIIVL